MGIIRNKDNFRIAYQLASKIQEIRKAKERRLRRKRMTQFEMSAKFNETMVI
jgi:hypothetical protein